MVGAEAVKATPEKMRQLAELAQGLRILIRFHDREVDGVLLEGLGRHRISEGLPSLFRTEAGQGAARALKQALDELGPTPDRATLDDLAADYADLYLTHGYRVSPSGSVWLTEDKLERQQPMFDVRDWYTHYGISVPDWRTRADDHLVHELEFVALLCKRGTEVAAEDAARFLGLHVLPWVPEFCRRAAGRVRSPLYVALMALTVACLDDLRDALEEITGTVRNIRGRPSDAARVAPQEATAYMPGLSESW